MSKLRNTTNKPYKIRLKKGDTVIVRSGKFKGKTGKISSVNSMDNTAVVEGLNIVKKHVKPDKQNPSGGIIELVKPLGISKLAIYDSVSKKPSRLGISISKDGSKKRVYKTTGKEVK